MLKQELGKAHPGVLINLKNLRKALTNFLHLLHQNIIRYSKSTWSSLDLQGASVFTCHCPWRPRPPFLEVDSNPDPGWKGILLELQRTLLKWSAIDPWRLSTVWSFELVRCLCCWSGRCCGREKSSGSVSSPSSHGALFRGSESSGRISIVSPNWNFSAISTVSLVLSTRNKWILNSLEIKGFKWMNKCSRERHCCALLDLSVINPNVPF